MRLSLGPSLADHKATAAKRVDDAAEAARLAWLTPGAGQATEYMRGEDEARQILALPVVSNLQPNQYPFVVAEQRAQAEVTGTTRTLRQIATEIVAQADTWRTVGSEIKRIRRTAKLRIDAAMTIAAVDAAAAGLSWPKP